MYLKKQIYILSCLLTISFISSIIAIALTGKKFEKVIINYAAVETERIASVILNDIIRIDDDYFNDDFFKITKDSNGNIQLIDFNSKKTNKLLKDINEKALKRLRAIEEGNTNDLELSSSLKGTRLTYLNNGIVCDIPLGVLFNNSILINLSPSIPIRFSFIGTVNSNLTTDVTTYGFNSALIKIGLEITIKEKVTMPHSSKSIPIKTTVNLATQIIQGQVPTYYNGSFSSESNMLTTNIK